MGMGSLESGLHVAGVLQRVPQVRRDSRPQPAEHVASRHAACRSVASPCPRPRRWHALSTGRRLFDLEPAPAPPWHLLSVSSG